MRPKDDIREWETDDILISIADWLLYEDRAAITWPEIQDILRAEPFFYQDERTHRKKRRYLEANGYLKRVNRVAYKVTEAGLARVRKAKGVPETPEDAPDDESSIVHKAPAVFEQSSVCHDVPDAWDMISALIMQRDGHRCRICGDTDNLRVRPKQPGHQGMPSDPNDLVTLCQACDRQPSAERNEVVDYLVSLRDASRTAKEGRA